MPSFIEYSMSIQKAIDGTQSFPDQTNLNDDLALFKHAVLDITNVIDGDCRPEDARSARPWWNPAHLSCFRKRQICMTKQMDLFCPSTRVDRCCRSRYSLAMRSRYWSRRYVRLDDRPSDENRLLCDVAKQVISSYHRRPSCLLLFCRTAEFQIHALGRAAGDMFVAVCRRQPSSRPTIFIHHLNVGKGGQEKRNDHVDF